MCHYFLLIFHLSFASLYLYCVLKFVRSFFHFLFGSSFFAAFRSVLGLSFKVECSLCGQDFHLCTSLHHELRRSTILTKLVSLQPCLHLRRRPTFFFLSSDQRISEIINESNNKLLIIFISVKAETEVFCFIALKPPQFSTRTLRCGTGYRRNEQISRSVAELTGAVRIHYERPSPVCSRTADWDRVPDTEAFEGRNRVLAFANVGAGVFFFIH